MISALVAVDSNQGIGLNGTIPWPHLHYDMLWFKQMTEGNYILMGRKTWESLNRKKLPDRRNIVISNKMHEDMDIWMPDVASAIEYYRIYGGQYRDLFIVGGSTIYEQCKKYISRWYVTEIDKDYTCDCFVDLKYIQQNFKNRIEIASFESPVSYKIYEYNNDTR